MELEEAKLDEAYRLCCEGINAASNTTTEGKELKFRLRVYQRKALIEEHREQYTLASQTLGEALMLARTLDPDKQPIESMQMALIAS